MPKIDLQPRQFETIYNLVITSIKEQEALVIEKGTEDYGCKQTLILRLYEIADILERIS